MGIEYLYQKAKKLPCEEVGTIVPEENMLMKDYAGLANALGEKWCLDVSAFGMGIKLILGARTRKEILPEGHVYGVIEKNRIIIARVSLKNNAVAVALDKALASNGTYRFRRI